MILVGTECGCLRPWDVRRVTPVTPVAQRSGPILIAFTGSVKLPRMKAMM